MSLNKLIILNYPKDYQFGIDLRVWTVGPNFRGIKNIPDGAHFVYYSASEGANNTSFFVHLSQGQIIVKKWCDKDEELVDVSLSESDMARFKSGDSEIEQYLGKYYSENHKDWWSLSNLLSLEMIDSLMPNCGRIYSTEQFISSQNNTLERLNVPRIKDQDGLDQLEIIPDTKINFLQIPKYLFPTDTTDRTKYMLDKTYTLESVLAQRKSSVNDPRELLAEFQLAFITYNIAFHLSALDQWLAIIDLLCSCVEGLTKYPDLFLTFLTVLHYQMKLTDEDFADITTHNNRFFNSMKKLFNVIAEEANVTDDLKTRALGLKKILSEKNDWDFDEELDEDLPTIVDINN